MLFSYVNPLCAAARARRARGRAEAGFDGALVTDLPPEEAGDVRPAVSARPGSTRSSSSRRPRPPRGWPPRPGLSSGSSTSSRGPARRERERTLPRDLPETVRRARRAAGGLAVAVGFGIATPKAARQAARLADGVVVGSALCAKRPERGGGSRRPGARPSRGLASSARATACRARLTTLNLLRCAPRATSSSSCGGPTCRPRSSSRSWRPGARASYHAVRRGPGRSPPHAPPDALALVSTLFWRDLAQLSADARVHPEVRRAADRDLLRRLPEMALAGESRPGPDRGPRDPSGPAVRPGSPGPGGRPRQPVRRPSPTSSRRRPAPRRPRPSWRLIAAHPRWSLRAVRPKRPAAQPGAPVDSVALSF